MDPCGRGLSGRRHRAPRDRRHRALRAARAEARRRARRAADVPMRRGRRRRRRSHRVEHEHADGLAGGAGDPRRHDRSRAPRARQRRRSRSSARRAHDAQLAGSSPLPLIARSADAHAIEHDHRRGHHRRTCRCAPRVLRQPPARTLAPVTVRTGSREWGIRSPSSCRPSSRCGCPRGPASSWWARAA